MSSPQPQPQHQYQHQSQFQPRSTSNNKPTRPSDFLSSHLQSPHSLEYRLTLTSTQSLKLSLFSHLLDSIPTSSYLLPRQVAPSNQHALHYFEKHGCSLPRAQKAAQEELRRLKGKDKGRERDSSLERGGTGSEVEALGHEYGSDRKGMPCGHVFKEGEPIYRCRDCGLDDTCVQCAPCFNASNHTGHDIVFSISSQGGGCCDCGDEEAWVQKVGCSYHDHDHDSELSTSSDSSLAAVGSSTGTNSTALDSMEQDSTSFSAASYKGKRVETGDNEGVNSDPLASLLDPIPNELRSSLSSGIQSYLEYVLQVLEHSPDDMSLPKGPDALETFKRLKSLEDVDEEGMGRGVSGIHSKRHGNSDTSLDMMDSESEIIEGSERDAEDEEEDIFLDGEDGMQVEIDSLDEENADEAAYLRAGWIVSDEESILDLPQVQPTDLHLEGEDDVEDHPRAATNDSDPDLDHLNNEVNQNSIIASSNTATTVGTGVGWSWARGFGIGSRAGSSQSTNEPQREGGVGSENGISTLTNEQAGLFDRSIESSAPFDSAPPSGSGFLSNSDVTPPQASSSFKPITNVDSNSTSSTVARTYSVILWNDEKHSFSEVIDTIKDAIQTSEKRAKEMAERVDRHGREIVESSIKLKQLFQKARIINHIDLTVTIRPSYDVFAEEVAGQVLNFLLDLSSAALYLPDSNSSMDSELISNSGTHPHDGFAPNASALRALVADVLLRPWNHKFPSVALQDSMSREFFDSQDLRNVDGLLLMDAKMWKEARSTTREIWLMIMGTKEVKKELAVRCAKMYPRMMETFILKDREQEHSICYMTVQLFSVPSIADHLVRNGFLQKLLQILQAVFTGHLSSGSLRLPPRSPASGRASPQSMPSRQQRCYQSFYDLRYLLQASGVQSQLASQSQHLESILDFLALFNAITPDRRAVSAHVEFETEVWLTVFHVSSHLGRVAKLFGEAFKKAEPLQLEGALQNAIGKIFSNSLALHRHDPETYSHLSFQTVNYGGKSYEVIDFAVEKQAVSFHHPMHWLLAEMMKHVSLIDPTGQGCSFNGSVSAISQSVMRNAKDLLVVLEFPLQVIVKLAQTRVGLWVRNGYALRSQAHHYRDNSMRDIMFDQDLYLLQSGFLLVEADVFLVSIMERFSLLEWFDSHDGRPQAAHETYDSDQRIAMADEMLLFLITLLSEVSVAAGWSMERQVRREIIQFLALGQGTYSELVKNISERLTDHAFFDRCLSQVAHFRSPDGTTDVGIFELKEECYEEVEPYFYHYTRNQREKAEEILCEKRKKKTGDSGVTIPQKLDIPTGPFKSILSRVLTNPTLLSIISSSLSNHATDEAGELPESLIESALHLLMLGSVEDDPKVQQSFLEGISTWVFDRQGNSRVNPNEVNSTNQFTLLRLILSLEDRSRFKAFKPKIAWILNKILETERSINGGGGFVSSIISTWRTSESKGAEETNETKVEDDKKAAAKARQAAIMQQFSAQHASLLASLDDDEDEVDEDDFDEMEGVDGEEVKSESTPKRSLGSCILCQENLDATQAFGSLAHVQASRVLRTTPRKDAGFLQQSLVSPLTMDQSGPDGKRIRGPDDFSSAPTSRPTLSKGLFPLEDHRFGFYASTCGHLMHMGCFESYCKSVEQRQGQQIARNHPEDLSRCEFVCPLCKSLGNIILPVPDANSHSSSSLSPSALLLRQLQSPQMNDTPLGEWIRRINIDILKCSTSSQGSEYQETEFGTGSFRSWFAEDQYTAFQHNRAIGSADKVDGATILMIRRLLQALKPLTAEAKAERSAFRHKTILAPPGKNMYMPEELLVYTVSMLEVSQRGIAFNPSNMGSDPLSGSVADSISDQTIQLLRSLLHCMRTLALIGKSDSSGLEPLRQGLLKRLLPHWGGDETVRSPLLLRNPLTILVEAAILIPDSIRQVTSLMFYASLVQAVFGLAQPGLWPQAHLHSQNEGLGGGFETRSAAGLRAKEAEAFDLETAKAIFPDVRWTVSNIIGFVGYARGNITLGIDNLDDSSLAKLLCSYTLPFLRRAAIIHRVVGGFDEKNGGGSRSQSSGSEYTRLLELLKIPPPSQGLPVRAEQQTPIAGLVEGWIKHGYSSLASLFRPLPIQPTPINSHSSAFESSSSSFASGSGGDSNSIFEGSNYGLAHLPSSQPLPTLLLEHPQIYELVPLPIDLARLIQTTQSRKCKKCKNVPPEPALCLLCGDLVCFQSFCCEDTIDGRGECNIHLDKCGGATGIFYRVKSNVVLLLHQKNGTFTSSPYLDSHGEIDIGLRKGRPQRLQHQRYDELRKQWLAHGVSNIVARKIEALMDQGGWDTF